MKSHWKSVVMIAALALCLGMAAPAWSQPTLPLADPMAEDYSVHVIPFYKIDQNWFSFLVVSDTSWQDLAFGNPPGGAPGGTPIFLNFYDADCALQSDAVVRPTRADSLVFALHNPNDAQGQFAGIPAEGVILLDGRAQHNVQVPPPGSGTQDVHRRFLTYILLINTNNNSMIRLDSIPCQGTLDESPAGYRPCVRGSDAVNSRWLRYDTFNTVAATFGDSDAGIFESWLYFFSAPPGSDLNADMLEYARPRHQQWAAGIHTDAWCDEIYLGSRRRDLDCTQRVRLSEFNYSLLVEFPNDACAGKPGRIETYASNDGINLSTGDYSGFHETIAELVHGVNMIGTGYMHHSENSSPSRRPLSGAGN